ncbi:hypothetical protein K443DRAFT_354895 [Laccaria amethystina LaAM-08-1]|uniref:Uncharacterized protein n=1 Tax=Laccaria amethystina LaAM-08-1 TaxID=1095629 RepID=A0A0C9WSF4_9AGAR|nr:hypothetical protein K443DRAFT_354895 [Laccaria amethystina LaAM-08-1]
MNTQFQNATNTSLASGSSGSGGIGKESSSSGTILAQPLSLPATVTSVASTTTPLSYPGSHVALVSGALAIFILVVTTISVFVLLRRQRLQRMRSPSPPPFLSGPHTRTRRGTKRSKRSPPLSGIWRSLQPRRSTETVQLSNVSRLSSSSRKSFILHKSISAPSSAFETNTPDSRQFCSSDDGSGIGLLNSSRYGSIADSRPQVPPILSHPQSTLSSLSSPSSSFFPDHSLRTCTTPSLTPVPRSFTHLDSGPLRWKDTESSTNVNARPTVIEGPPPGYEYGRRIERRPRLGFFPSWWVRALPKAADLNDPGGEH